MSKKLSQLLFETTCINIHLSGLKYTSTNEDDIYKMIFSICLDWMGVGGFWLKPENIPPSQWIPVLGAKEGWLTGSSSANFPNHPFMQYFHQNRCQPMHKEVALKIYHWVLVFSCKTLPKLLCLGRFGDLCQGNICPPFRLMKYLSWYQN